MIHSKGGAYRGAGGGVEAERELRGLVCQLSFSSAGSSVVNARTGGRQHGADGVDGADLGVLHLILPGDPA